MLKDEVIAYNKRIKEALEVVFNELNKGQQRKILKNDTVKELFKRYKVGEPDE